MYAGRVLRGLIIAIPQFAVIAILVWTYLERGSGYLAGWLYVEAFGVAIANVLMLAYRAFAVVDAYVVARSAHAPTRSRDGGR